MKQRILALGAFCASMFAASVAVAEPVASINTTMMEGSLDTVSDGLNAAAGQYAPYIIGVVLIGIAVSLSVWGAVMLFKKFKGAVK